MSKDRLLVYMFYPNLYRLHFKCNQRKSTDNQIDSISKLK